MWIILEGATDWNDQLSWFFCPKNLANIFIYFTIIFLTNFDLPEWFTSAYRGSPPCAIFHNPDNKEILHSNVLDLPPPPFTVSLPVKKTFFTTPHTIKMKKNTINTKHEYLKRLLLWNPHKNKHCCIVLFTVWRKEVELTSWMSFKNGKSPAHGGESSGEKENALQSNV